MLFNQSVRDKRRMWKKERGEMVAEVVVLENGQRGTYYGGFGGGVAPRNHFNQFIY